ncbi:hypothetical protein RA307_19235 [Xanthobacteraceae bacterium Astr-EGSB]|uniref:hypothetical protein n=1 Tax=Astrobacterium formosum TaxID=3069710 RepID=UPI0027B13F6E|nr:hypothetical protein [Xanthobacteraceae bacterium Astr-EGSB]
MSHRFACFTMAGLLALASGIMPAAAQGSEEERRACTPDAMRLCREYIPNVERIIACMVARRAELSPACQAFFKPDEPETTTVATAPAKPSRTASRSGARKKTAAKPAPVTTAAPASRNTRPARQVQSGRKNGAPMNLLPAAPRPAPAKKPAARDKQAQRTQ